MKVIRTVSLSNSSLRVPLSLSHLRAYLSFPPLKVSAPPTSENVSLPPYPEVMSLSPYPEAVSLPLSPSPGGVSLPPSPVGVSLSPTQSVFFHLPPPRVSLCFPPLWAIVPPTPRRMSLSLRTQRVSILLFPSPEFSSPSAWLSDLYLSP